MHDEYGMEIKFACRVCNDCINARKNDWVARGMAEKAMSGETLVITLTYRNNPDGTTPARAKAFHYADVQAFLKSLREEYFRKYDTRNEISYIVAGERGSQKGRVHWHLVVFAKRPVTPLGKWFDKYQKPLRSLRELVFGKKDRYHWNFWPHGHVNVLEPDQGGLSYVLKYALKDQFNVVKSKGTMREAKAENHGASYFRMSKKPPIGWRWLEQKLDDWERRLVVPPTLLIKPPDYSGYWYPKRKFRENLLIRLHNINQKSLAERGRDCPQWNSLLSSVSELENQTDWEGLYYGKIEEETVEEYDLWEWQERLGEKWLPSIRERCGGLRICKHCWFHQTKKERRAYWRYWQEITGEFVRDTSGPDEISLKAWYRAKKQCNPFCLSKNDDLRKQAFE